MKYYSDKDYVVPEGLLLGIILVGIIILGCLLTWVGSMVYNGF